MLRARRLPEAIGLIRFSAGNSFYLPNTASTKGTLNNSTVDSCAGAEIGN